MAYGVLVGDPVIGVKHLISSIDLHLPDVEGFFVRQRVVDVLEVGFFAVAYLCIRNMTLQLH